MAMTEDELLTAIETTLRAAHLACQPYYLQLAELWLPGLPMARTESYVSSSPTGRNAQSDRISIAIMPA